MRVPRGGIKQAAQPDADCLGNVRYRWAHLHGHVQDIALNLGSHRDLERSADIFEKRHELSVP